MTISVTPDDGLWLVVPVLLVPVLILVLGLILGRAASQEQP